MRCWIILSLAGLVACTAPAKDGAVLVDEDSVTNPSSAGAADSPVRLASDTTTHASFAPPQRVKSPSGIYQFLLPYNDNKKLLHTVAFYPGGFRLQEQYIGEKDSVVVTEGTWAPSQGFIWLYKEQLVRGRYAWKDDTLQYYSPRLQRRFSLTKLQPASNENWTAKKAQGTVLVGLGTEPFWSVEINQEDSLVFSMPEWTAPLRLKLTTKERNNTTTVYWAEDSLQVTVAPSFCSDGMSDFVYPNTVRINYKGKVYKGCGKML